MLVSSKKVLKNLDFLGTNQVVVRRGLFPFFMSAYPAAYPGFFSADIGFLFTDV